MSARRFRGITAVAVLCGSCPLAATPTYTETSSVSNICVLPDQNLLGTPGYEVPGTGTACPTGYIGSTVFLPRADPLDVHGEIQGGYALKSSASFALSSTGTDTVGPGSVINLVWQYGIGDDNYLVGVESTTAWLEIDGTRVWSDSGLPGPQVIGYLISIDAGPFACPDGCNWMANTSVEGSSDGFLTATSELSLTIMTTTPEPLPLALVGAGLLMTGLLRFCKAPVNTRERASNSIELLNDLIATGERNQDRNQCEYSGAQAGIRCC
jgi:hypothetical protein